MSEKQVRRTVYLSRSVDNEIDQYCGFDGAEFRNRSHALEIILKKWLQWRREQKTRGEQRNIFDSK